MAEQSDHFGVEWQQNLYMFLGQIVTVLDRVGQRVTVHKGGGTNDQGTRLFQEQVPVLGSCYHFRPLSFSEHDMLLFLLGYLNILWWTGL